MWPRRREKTLLDNAKSQELESLAREQRWARYKVEEPARLAAEKELLQNATVSIARINFSDRFGVKPEIVGWQETEVHYGPINAPVFGIEYAKLLFVPGESMTHFIKYPTGSFIYGVGKAALRDIQGLINPDIKIYDRYPLATSHNEFALVDQCSGCGSWGRLGSLESNQWKTGRSLYVSTPQEIFSYEDLARHLALINDGASDLALDCDSLSVFGLRQDENQTIIQCPNILSVVKEENRLHGPSDKEIEENRIRIRKAQFGLFDE